MIALLLVAGVLLDLWLGEVRRWHPLVGFGRIAGAIERRFNRRSYLLGGFAWAAAVLPPVLLAGIGLYALAGSHAAAVWINAAIHVALLYFCIGLRSLHDHVMPIEESLRNGHLDHARSLTSRIVSRDTQQAEESDLAKAAAESVLENGNDAVFGTLFWFAVAGGPGALLFRLANTLDAMWGYRTQRYLAFGCVAARVDDLLNLIPARLTAASYALLGNTRQALRCWRMQAPQWSSPNAGPVMAAGAGALDIMLGGTATYDGVAEDRPLLGHGQKAVAADIGRAWRLVAKTTLLWLAAIAIAAVFFMLKG